MKEQYVRDLVEGARVDSVFTLRSRDIRSARTGDPFLSLEIADCTGSIGGVMFRPTASDEALPVGSVIRLRGSVSSYRGTRRIAVESFSPVASHDPEDLLAGGLRPRSEMLEELRATVRRIGDRRLRGLARTVFGAPGFIDRFAICPGSVGDHHAYVGGLLEHTLAVAGLCTALARAYPHVDGDLLLTSALLHDVGKVDALRYDTAFDHTEAGRLLGHVVLGERVISRAFDSMQSPPPVEVGMRLLHAVLTHHGRPERGVQGHPCSIEALLLNKADQLDAEASVFMEATLGAGVLAQGWTGEANRFGQPLLVPRVPVEEVRKRDCA